MRPLLLLAGCAAMLGACQNPAPTEKAANGAEPTEQVADDKSSNRGGNDAPSADPDDNQPGNADEPAAPHPSDQPGATIPAAFRGRWGETLDACRKLVEDRDGVMTVTSSELHFNELRAEATSVALRSPTRVSVNAKVDEPSRNFTFFTDLVLADGGNALVREEEGPRQRYVRCPRASGRPD